MMSGMLARRPRRGLGVDGLNSSDLTGQEEVAAADMVGMTEITFPKKSATANWVVTQKRIRMCSTPLFGLFTTGIIVRSSHTARPLDVLVASL